MTYSGNINEINQIIVSDPSYEKGVWCRYENENLSARNWNFNIEISEYNERVEDLDLRGIEFTLLLSNPNIRCRLTDKGVGYPKSKIVDKFTIGMDTACVSLGINDVADKIRSEQDEWQPSTCLRTLTDGEFGTVFEGRNPNSDEVDFIVIMGYLDEDTGYSEENLVKYFEKNFAVENLSPVMSENDEMTLDGM